MRLVITPRGKLIEDDWTLKNMTKTLYTIDEIARFVREGKMTEQEAKYILDIE